MDECRIEKWVKLPVNGVVEQPIPDARLVNISWFRIGNVKRVVSTMNVRFVFQLEMKCENIIRKSILEILHVFFAALPFQELFPRLEQVFDRNDMVVHVYLF